MHFSAIFLAVARVLGQESWDLRMPDSSAHCQTSWLVALRPGHRAEATSSSGTAPGRFLAPTADKYPQVPQLCPRTGPRGGRIASPCGQFTELLGRLDTWLLHLKAGSTQAPHSFSLFASRTWNPQVRIHVTAGGASEEALSHEGRFQRRLVNARASAPHTLLSDGHPGGSRLKSLLSFPQAFCF